MSKENTVVVIGSGGAESALVEAYGKSPHVDRIIAVPGNDMMQELVPDKEVDILDEIQQRDSASIVKALNPIKRHIALVDIRNESAIASGLTDQLRRNKIMSASPSRDAGRLEWDKTYTRDLMQELMVEQPPYDKLDFKNGKQKSYEAILDRYGRQTSFVKANGLADGKGVIGADNSHEIEMAIQKLRREYPQATDKILIERGIVGEEFSAFAICAAGEYRILGYAQDHKRAFDGDKGPNTGGMGAVSNPLLIQEPNFTNSTNEIFARVLKRMKGINKTYKGVLYQGAMAVDTDGSLKQYLVEFNARWGDPEAQVLIPGLTFDLFEMNYAISQNKMPDFEITNDGKVRVVVTLASQGYPEDYSHVLGKEINGIDEAKKSKGVVVYGAAVKKEGDKYYVNGGRLLYVVGEGKDVVEARGRAYEGASHVKIYDSESNNLAHFRMDIGYRDINRIKNKDA